jgi:single-stranded-DNA-specific exonuclease
VAAVDVIDEHTLGFVFGPCINAGGRIGNSKLGAVLLSTKNQIEAKEIASQLFNLNIERREIENAMKEDAIAKLDLIDFSTNHIIIIGSADYHQGVIGILASRLKEKYNRPAIVYSKLEYCVKASARSITGIDIGGFVNNAVEKGILLAGGGHEMAAGFTCEIEKLEEFEELINKKLGKQVQELTSVKVLEYSCEILLAEINMVFYNELEKMRPFGVANFKPVFCVKNVEIAFFKKRGEKHLFVVLADSWQTSIKGMFFGFFENYSEEFLGNLVKRKLNVLCQISLNNWNGASSIELNISDIQFS